MSITMLLFEYSHVIDHFHPRDNSYANLLEKRNDLLQQKLQIQKR